MALRRSKPAGPSPLVTEMLRWADEFQAGTLNDPAVVDGTLAPGERFALRIGPVTEVDFEMGPQGPRVVRVGATGSLVVSDHRAVLQVETGPPSEWAWDADVGGVTQLANGLGVMWTPSPARFEAGVHHLGGVVVPAFARGQVTGQRPLEERSLLPMFMRVRVAWMASQPGGLEAWRAEFTAKYGGG